MNQAVFLNALKKDGFSEPIFIVKEGSGFLEQDPHPYSVRAINNRGAN